MKVTVVGGGYVGLVTAACLAEKGHEVVCVELDPERVERINRGQAPIHEAGLEALLGRNVPARLTASTDLAEAMAGSEVTLIAVGTPSEGGAIDLTQVRSAARQVGRALRDREGYHVVALKSTAVPGTVDEVLLPTLEEASGRRAGPDFGVGTNPEFLRQGTAVEDFMNPDRIVLGGMDERTLAVLERLYAGFDGVEKVRTTNRTAATIKYAANALLATMISFSNEVADFCSAVGGVDVADVLKGVHLDRRLSPRLDDGRRVRPGFLDYLEAGCGFGGSCFPKDVEALISHGREMGSTMRILEAVIAINEERPARLVSLLDPHFASLASREVAVLGLAFKPGTDDLRGTPALPAIEELRSRGARVRAYDPVARLPAPLARDEGVVQHETLEEALRDVDAVLLVTSWPEFERLDELLDGRDPEPVVVDGRRVLDPSAFGRYEGIGRRESRATVAAAG